MSSGDRCRECGSVIPADSPGGFCAQCLLGLGLGEVPSAGCGGQNAGGGEQGAEGAGQKDEATETPPPDSGLESAHILSAPLKEKPGHRIGRYKLLQEIGHGGCGVVYMAEQEAPVRRKVALKVIKLGMDTRQVVARFEAERQALAMMDHPNIAKVLDAGATDTGRPYFVMELVDGIQITDYCDQNELTTRQRLELFTHVCRGIQHAHQKGVIHRDIKPSNVLVATQDGIAVPKVIDFGIAKATQGRRTDHTLFTAFEQFLGTPAYMSPEQAQLGGLGVDTRSDIYSLGVLLYELLTGRTPFDTKELIAAGLDEMRRTIREVEPVKPSTRLTQELAARSAGSGKSELRTPHSALDKDLDWIVMKCLEKDRARRYETANGLATDIQRHLNNEPVVARPPSKLYEFQKTVRRHRFGFAATAAIILLLAIGTTLSTWQAVRARRAEREQSRLRQEAQAAREDAREKLWASYLSEAHALRLSGQSGRRFKSLAALRQAAAIRPTPALRNEAIKCMVLADLQAVGGRDFSKSRQMVGFHAAFAKHALGDETGSISVKRGAGDAELARLPPTGHAVLNNPLFSPDGKFLAACYADKRWRVWDWAKGTPVIELPWVPSSGAAFTPDSRKIAITGSSNLVLHDLASGARLKTISLAGLASTREPWVRFHPSGQRIALFYLESATKVVIMGIESGQVLGVLPHSTFVFEAAWHPDGQHLAVGCGDGFIHLWDVTSGKHLRSWQAGSSVSLGFNHRGDLLASSGWDGKTRLWEFPSGRELVSIHKSGHILGFSPDDRRLTLLYWDGTGLDFLEATVDLGLRTLHDQWELKGSPGGQAAFSPPGRLVAGTTLQGITVWDARTGREACTLVGAGERYSFIGFDVAGNNLILTSPNGLLRWPIPSAEGGFELPSLMNTEFADHVHSYGGTISADGKVCGVGVKGRCRFLRTDDFRIQGESGVQPGMSCIALSPDGSLAASGAWHFPGVNVWKTRTGELIKHLPAAEDYSDPGSSVAFSSDGRELVISTPDEYCFWRVADWSLARKISQEPGNDLMATMAFSRDGKIFAGTHTRNVIRLYDAANLEVLADLEAPNSSEITSLSFNQDGTQLAACESKDALRIWDLRRIREQLAGMGLDWEEPPYPAKSTAALSPPATPESAAARPTQNSGR